MTADPISLTASGPAARSPRSEDLLRRAQFGDQAAREALCHRFLPLARRLASRYRSTPEAFEDLLQVASVGLLGAIDRYDPQRGVSFTTFAIPTILGELKRHFRDTGWATHVPRGAQERWLRVNRAAQVIAEETGRPATPPAIAVYLELSIEEVLDGLEVSQARYSMPFDLPVAQGEGDPLSLVEVLGTEEQGYGLFESRASLAVALERLPHLERRALRLRMEDDLRQTEIADVLGCSQMQVSRLLRRAIENLRRQLDAYPLVAGACSPTSYE